MAIPQGHKNNFETLKRAFEDRNVALMECIEIATGDTVYVICAAEPDGEGGATFAPFAQMFKENPYDEWKPPQAEDGTVAPA